MALCEKPYIVGSMPCPCGTCDVCRIRRRRLWANRLMLESYCHGDSIFVTLTYDDEHKPMDGSVNPKHTQDWLKRLRQAIYPRKVRYFIAGEYGDETWRPHYHAAVFGLSPMDESIVRDTWSMGHVMVGTLTPASAAYVAGYVTKKMTSPADVRLAGKHPEFCRMSLKPGIGAQAMKDVARALSHDAGLDDVVATGDVPHQMRHGVQFKPLGRYLRSKLREELGFAEKATPKEVVDAYKAEMLELLKGNVAFEKGEAREVRRWKIQKFFLDTDAQKLRNVKARSKIYSQRKEL